MASITKCSDDILTVKELALFVRQNIKRIIEKEKITSYTVNVTNISANGGNYLGSLQTVAIKGISKDDEEKELNLFIKNAENIDDFSVFDVSMLYSREGYVYNEVFKLFEKIEDKYKIPQEDRLNTITSFCETNSKVIILEDVTKMGYKTYDRFDIATIKFAELVVEQLAKLHAMSFVIQNEHPTYFDNNIKSLHSLFNLTADFNKHVRRCCDNAMENLEGDAKIKIDNFYLKIIEKYPKYVNVPAEEAICLVHGDFRTNNVLVREVDGEPSKVTIVDYQLVHFGYPIIDFVFFVFIGTDQKFRKDHLEDLKNLYYSKFENFLSKFKIEAKRVFSKEQFEKEYKNKLDYGLMIFLIVTPFVFVKADEITKFADGLEGASFNLDERYKDRLHGIVDDLIQWGYL